MTTTTADSLLAAYAATDRGSGVDELVDQLGQARPHWIEIADAFDKMGADELHRRTTEIRRLLEQDGVTYNVGTGGRRRHQPWNLDVLPVVLPRTEWDRLKRGVVQRAELLNLVLDDLYGDRRLMTEGVVPASVVLGDPQFLRECDGIKLPGDHQLVMCATDVVRTAGDGWIALAQRTQSPSGASYAAENRRVLARVFPSIFHNADVQPITPYLQALGEALRNAAPPDIDDPGIVILSAGPMSETAFEHASLAAHLGYPLVGGNDLQVREGKVWLRTVGGLTRVHVILRRVDAWFADPLELRPDSTLGVAGLVDATRTGAVSVVNTLGSGVLENAALHTFLPELSTRLLGQDLLLPAAGAWWCGDDAQRSHVLANLGQLIVRPASRHGLGSSIDTSQCSQAELDTLSNRIQQQPHEWVGQELISLATSPLMGADGFDPLPTVLRTYAVSSGEEYATMAGGLAQAAPADRRAVALRAGAIAKDVWVTGQEVAARRQRVVEAETDAAPVGAMTPAARAAENLFWLGRYGERAEATVRLLRVVSERRDEFGHVPGPGAAALGTLLQTLSATTGTFPGFVADNGTELMADPDQEIRALLAQSDKPGSVAHAIVHMFDAIDVLRDQISVDTWLVVGSLQRELDVFVSLDNDQSRDMTRVLNDLVEGLLALAGVSSESTMRDPAWHFTECGRRIERALQTSALLTSTLSAERGAAAESLLLESVLVAAESIITYRRRYRSMPRVRNVLALLVHDVDNPRSIAFQLAALERSLPLLLPGQIGARSVAIEATIQRLIAVVGAAESASLAAASPTGSRDSLVALGNELQSELRTLSDLITDQYFSKLMPQRSVVTPIGARHP